jgi:hypothetical protein
VFVQRAFLVTVQLIQPPRLVGLDKADVVKVYFCLSIRRSRMSFRGGISICCRDVLGVLKG